MTVGGGGIGRREAICLGFLANFSNWCFFVLCFLDKILELVFYFIYCSEDFEN